MMFSKIKMKLSLNHHGSLTNHTDDITAIIKIDNRFALTGGLDKRLVLWDVTKF